jgi:hypothetical protein
MLCRGDELGYGDDCKNPAVKTIKVDGEVYVVCQDCYDEADAYRMARWQDYYRNR